MTRVRVLLDGWIDVQRRWVYLEGLFMGSADIKSQLPNEFQRFRAIDTEFVNLMRKVCAAPVLRCLRLCPFLFPSGLSARPRWFDCFWGHSPC